MAAPPLTFRFLPAGSPAGRSGIRPPSYQCTSTSGMATFGMLSRAGKMNFTRCAEGADSFSSSVELPSTLVG